MFNLKQIGIDSRSSTTTFTLAGEGATRGEPFDLASAGWFADYADRRNFFVPTTGGRLLQRGQLNDANFDDPRMTARIEGGEPLRGEARRKAWADLDVELMRDDPPWALIVQPERPDVRLARASAASSVTRSTARRHRGRLQEVVRRRGPLLSQLTAGREATSVVARCCFGSPLELAGRANRTDDHDAGGLDPVAVFARERRPAPRVLVARAVAFAADQQHVPRHPGADLQGCAASAQEAPRSDPARSSLAKGQYPRRCLARPAQTPGAELLGTGQGRRHRPCESGSLGVGWRRHAVALALAAVDVDRGDAFAAASSLLGVVVRKYSISVTTRSGSSSHGRWPASGDAKDADVRVPGSDRFPRLGGSLGRGTRHGRREGTRSEP